MPTSPQSTLGIMDCGGSQGSSRGSPNGRSRPTSPPATWDVLHAAAGQVQRMKTGEEGTGYFDGVRGISDRYKNTIPVPIPAPGTNSSSNSGLFYDHHQTERLKQVQMMKLQKQHQKQGVWGDQRQTVHCQNKARNKSFKPLGLSSSAWPPLLPQLIPQPRQPKSSAMRAVFLDPPANRRGCPGTGVFLPRQVGTAAAAEPRKKSGYSTVLLPARVVQALNLNLEDIGAQARSVGGVVRAGGDVSLKLRTNRGGVVHAQEKRNLRQAHAAAAAAPNPELQLPQEWTY